MKRTGLVWLLLTGIMVTGVFGSGKKDNAAPSSSASSAAGTSQEETNTTNGEENPVPLVPITQDIIYRLVRNGLNIKGLQYYISSSIILENEKKTEVIEINNKGEGVLRATSIQREIRIDKETKGVLKNDPGSSNSYAFEVCFDEDYRNSLFFKRNSAGTRFDLVYDTGTQSITYGQERYQLRMDEDSPHLLIKYKEETSSEPNIQQVSGRSVSQN
jgi:hypothetical protein